MAAGLQEAVTDLRYRLSDGRRTLLGIAGEPGSGKSTFAAMLRQQLDAEQSVVVPMDGFHLGNTVIAGTELSARKGAIDTFDVGGFISLLQRLARADESVVYAPDFSRSADEPIAASIAVPAKVPLVIVEGNYLLADGPQWGHVRDFFNEVWFLEIPDEVRLARLAERHMRFGKDRETAEAWAQGSDQINTLQIRETKHQAHRIIQWS